jgi:hypothetical protein
MGRGRGEGEQTVENHIFPLHVKAAWIREVARCEIYRH